MAMADNFITRLDNLDDFPKLYKKTERFGEFNNKTLGFLLVFFLFHKAM